MTVVELGIASLTGAHAQRMAGLVGHGCFTEYLPSHLASGYRIVRDWPHPIRELLTEVVGAPHSKVRPTNALRKFFVRNAATSPLRDLLRALEIGHRNCARTPLVKTGNTTELVKRFKIDLKTLRRLHGKGLCYVAKGPRKRNSTRYDIELLSASIAQLRGAVPDTECSRVLGVPAFCIPALASVGLLEEVTDHDALLMAPEKIFHRASVAALADSLSNLPPTDGQQEGVAVSAALLRRLNPVDWADILTRLLSGQILVLRKEVTGKGALNELIVGRREIETVLNCMPRRALPQNIYLSNVRAADILGVSKAAMGHVVQDGWIKGRRGKMGRMEIPLAEVAAFDRAYVTGIEGARAIGVTTQKVASRMRRSGLSPACRFRYLTVWKRDEAEPAFERILKQKGALR